MEKIDNILFIVGPVTLDKVCIDISAPCPPGQGCKIQVGAPIGFCYPKWQDDQQGEAAP